MIEFSDQSQNKTEVQMWLRLCSHLVTLLKICFWIYSGFGQNSARCGCSAEVSVFLTVTVSSWTLFGLPCVVDSSSSKPVTEFPLCGIHLTLSISDLNKGRGSSRSSPDWTEPGWIAYLLIYSKVDWLVTWTWQNTPSYMRFPPAPKGREGN